MRLAHRLTTLGTGSAISLMLACAPAPGGVSTAPSVKPQLTSADFKDSNDPIEVIIQRKVPGLALNRNSNGELVLRIRGKVTMQEGVVATPAGQINIDDPQPLYVIDGTPIRASNPLSGLSRDDIETVTVLKGPEGAIYGTDALNGVIVIQTKRGGKKTP